VFGNHSKLKKLSSYCNTRCDPYSMAS